MKIIKKHFAEYSIEVSDKWDRGAEGNTVCITVEEGGVFDTIAEVELFPEDITNLVLHMERLLAKL
jgi:hypothetical protein